MKRIFISYKRVDKDNVLKIKERIETGTGQKCWMDVEGIESDAQFKNVIISAINNAEVVLFMYSKAHSKIVDFENDWTVRELNFAKAKKKRIVFINIDGTPLTDEFAFDFGTKQQIDASSEEHLTKLISDIKKWLSITGKKTIENIISNVKCFDLGYELTVFAIHKLRGQTSDEEEVEIASKMIEAGLNPDLLLRGLSPDNMIVRLCDCAVELGRKSNKHIENSVCLGSLFVLSVIARRSNISVEFAHSYDKGLIIASQALGVPSWAIERMVKADSDELESMREELRNWIK